MIAPLLVLAFTIGQGKNVASATVRPGSEKAEKIANGLASEFPSLKRDSVRVSARRMDLGFLRESDGARIYLEFSTFVSREAATEAARRVKRNPGGFDRRTSFTGRPIGDEVWTVWNPDGAFPGWPRVIAVDGSNVVIGSMHVWLPKDPKKARRTPPQTSSSADVRLIEDVVISGIERLHAIR